MRITNSKKCFACGAKLQLKEIGYEPNMLKSYHRDYMKCRNEHHPNSPEMQRLRGRKEILLPGRPKEFFESIQDIYPEYLLKHIERLTAKTASFRPTPPQVMHLLKVQEKHDLHSINETVAFMIGEHMIDHEKDYDDEPVKVVNWEQRRRLTQEDLFPPEKEETKDPIKEVIKEPEPEPEPEPDNDDDEGEDEFVI